MTEKQIGGNGMAKRQPTVLRVPENGAGDPFFGRQGNWFEVIFESSYDGFYITDGNAITLTLNKSYETISGLRKEEMVGRSMAELVASRVSSGSGTLLALERRESVTMEQQFKTGKRAIITSTPVFDSESNIVMVVTNVRDVTELYSLKEKLEQSEERNRLYSAELEAARSRQDRNPSSLIFHDKSMQNVISLLNRAAQMEVPVLLQGEVGVGKGALSEYIHSKSKRRKEHFITIPCASLPDDTMVAELFGLGPGVSPEYPQGKVGLLEQANRGVVFLDEVEQLNHECQTRLLSVIKRRQVKPLGYGADKPCDLRIIASTSADLLALVREKKFREDLYYALSVLPINVPPLRERREDIIPLINHFLMVENQKYHTNKSIYSDTIDAFEGYCWPGNVRACSTSDALICQMDFCASFAGLLGQDYPAEDGVRLDKALLGKSKKGRESLVLEGYGRSIWIKEGDWACVPAYKNWKGNMTAPELYDLKKDVAQKHNIAAQYPKRVQEMTAKLEQVRNNKK